jgi:2-dehydropantoate 2-reductase
MKVLIYGGGSVGLGIASCLLKSQKQVCIIARNRTVEALRQNGLVREGIFGDHHADSSDFTCSSSLNEAEKWRYDYILVCTKSFDSYHAAKDIARNKFCFEKAAPIVLFQNGWGNTDIFASFFPETQIFNARVITGFSRTEPHTVKVTVHADAIHIGSLYEEPASRIEPLCNAISAGGIPCKPTCQIEQDLWAKMLYNCALNPLGAILDVPYGALARADSTRFIMDNIVEEIFRVLDVTGYKTHWKKAADFLDIFYKKLVPATAEHRSSTLQDIQAGKKTEIDALNGAVIKLAQEHQVDVPCNQTLYNLIRFIESGRNLS